MDSNVLIFIREATTFKFANESGVWIRGFAKARKFRSTWEAVEFSLKRNLREAQIVMRTAGDVRYDVILDCLHDPLQDGRRRKQERVFSSDWSI
jgi:hypothetical protein